MNGIIGLIKEFVKGNNWVNTIVLIAIFWNLKGELSTINTALGIQDVKIENNASDICDNQDDIKTINKSISIMAVNFATHIGDAYIREDSPEIED